MFDDNDQLEDEREVWYEILCQYLRMYLACPVSRPMNISIDCKL